MKTRNGFVSNSSSSSFIVEIPEDYKIDNKSFVGIEDVSCLFELNDCYDEDSDLFDDDGTILNQEIVDEANELIIRLINEKYLYQDDIGAWYEPLIELFDKENFIVFEGESAGGDGAGSIRLFEDLRKLKKT